MTFINPYLLWGALAVAIPILIHFWHQKRGKVIEWAAMQWLIEKNQQQQRGLKFDNWLLLLLRSLLVLLLVLLLSQPSLNWLTKPEAVQPIHLIQPAAGLVSNFRFELEEALKKGEKVYWANADVEPVTTLALPRNQDGFTVLTLQSAINKLGQQKAPLHLYVVNTQQLADVPFIYVPTAFRLHTLTDPAREPRRFLAAAQTNVFVDESGRLANKANLPQTVRFIPAPAHEGPLSVGLSFRDKTERQTIRAALDALTDVYKFGLTIDEQIPAGKRYDVVLTDRLPAAPSARTLYIVSGVGPSVMAANVINVSGPFSPQSEMVGAGQLPEWLGEQLVTYFGLNPIQQPLSQQQLNALFVPADRRGETHPADDTQSAVHGGLLLALVILIGIERWLALTKNA